MPRKPTAEYWVERIRTLNESQGLGPRAISARLREEDPDGARGRPMSEKTIARKLKEFHALPEAERRAYRLFAWPASMLDGSLPWEASGPLLELLRYLESTVGRRPSLRLAVWYWRAYHAVPDAGVGIQLDVARTLEAWGTIAPPTPQDLVAFEAMVAYAPWRSDAGYQAYRSAVKKRVIPDWPHFDVSPPPEPSSTPVIRPRSLSGSVDLALGLVDEDKPE
jgi:hypothetical protein